MPYTTTGSPIVSADGDNEIIKFYAGGTITLSETHRVEILVVGGGGSGATFGGGAGGGGGVSYSDRQLSAGTYTVIVGAGGAATTNAGNTGGESLFATSGGLELVKASGGFGGQSGSGGRPGGASGIGYVDGLPVFPSNSGSNDTNASGGGGGAGSAASGKDGGDGINYGGFESGFLFGAGSAGETSGYVSGVPGLDGGVVAQAAPAAGSGAGGGGSWATTPDNPTGGGSGVVLIRFYPNPESGSASKVSGVVQVSGTPAKRAVRAFGYTPVSHSVDGDAVNLSKSLGHAFSDPETGEYTINLLAGYADPVFVVAFDDYGADFKPDLAVAVGDRVHPTNPNGYVWECTGSGTLPSEEPAWVIDTQTAQLYGTASMIARPFYRPMVHGPVTPEVVQQDPAP